jgi:hypothetical protein
MAGIEDPVGHYLIQRDMERAGYMPITTMLGLNGLVQKEFVDWRRDADFNGNEQYVYWATGHGMKWLVDNQSRLGNRSARWE